MPDDLVEIAERVRQNCQMRSVMSPPDPERFLLDEGLDLLANYRTIVDQSVRTLVADFVREVAALQNTNCREQPVVLELVGRHD